MFEFLKIYHVEHSGECYWMRSDDESSAKIDDIKNLRKEERGILKLLESLTSEGWELYPFSNGKTPYQFNEEQRIQSGSKTIKIKRTIQVFYLKKIKSIS